MFVISVVVVVEGGGGGGRVPALISFNKHHTSKPGSYCSSDHNVAGTKLTHSFLMHPISTP